MASVHRDARNRSPYWYAAYTLPDGTRCLKSTKLKERSKALKLAMEWENLARSVAERDPMGTQIARVNVDIYERATGQRVEVVFLGDFLRSWSERAANLKSKRTGMRYKQVVEDFLDHIGPARAKSNLGSVRESDVQSFLDQEAKDGKSATTVAIAAKVLRIPFNLALKQGLILRQPVSSLDIPDGNAQQKKAFTWPQVLKLISVAEGDWITAVMLGAYCGMRLGDCVNLQWENVNLDEDLIRFVPEKTSRGQTAQGTQRADAPCPEAAPRRPTAELTRRSAPPLPHPARQKRRWPQWSQQGVHRGGHGQGGDQQPGQAQPSGRQRSRLQQPLIPQPAPLVQLRAGQ
jgi:integrase